MLNIEGYFVDLEPFFRGDHSIIVKAIRELDSKLVAIKLQARKRPTDDDVARFEYEYEVSKLFSNESDIVNVLAFEKYQKDNIIIMEYIGYPTLKEILSKDKTLKLIDFLVFAVNVTKALNKIHIKEIIHKDINPSNILYDIKEKKVKIIV